MFRADLDTFRTHVEGVAALRGAALDLLAAVDEGRPAGDLARAMALEALRAATPDTKVWNAAVSVIEGGPLRMRRAVELAGLIVEAVEVSSEGLRAKVGCSGDRT